MEDKHSCFLQNNITKMKMTHTTLLWLHLKDCFIIKLSLHFFSKSKLTATFDRVIYSKFILYDITQTGDMKENTVFISQSSHIYLRPSTFASVDDGIHQTTCSKVTPEGSNILQFEGNSCRHKHNKTETCGWFSFDSPN